MERFLLTDRKKRGINERSGPRTVQFPKTAHLCQERGPFAFPQPTTVVRRMLRLKMGSDYSGCWSCTS
jgi:hypothetical protein